MNIFRKIKMFFLCKSATKELLEQKNKQKENIGQRRELDAYIIKYTKKIFKLHNKIRAVDSAFYLKPSKHEDTKHIILVPILLYVVQISCCTKLKIVISLNKPQYIRFKLFIDGKNEGTGDMKDMDTCFAVIETLLRQKICKDEK